MCYVRACKYIQMHAFAGNTDVNSDFNFKVSVNVNVNININVKAGAYNFFILTHKKENITQKNNSRRNSDGSLLTTCYLLPGLCAWHSRITFLLHSVCKIDGTSYTVAYN